MDELEQRLAGIAGMPRAERPADALALLRHAIATLNTSAAMQPDVHSSIAILERAMMWCDHLDDFRSTLEDDSSVITDAAPTVRNLRSQLMKAEAWPQALSVAQRALQCDDAIAKLAGRPPPSLVDKLQIRMFQPDIAKMSAALSLVHLCTIHSKLGQHQAAAPYAQAATQLLQSLLAQHPDVGGLDGMHPGFLLTVAFDSWSCELAHLGKRKESRDVLESALATGRRYLPPTHPLIVRLLRVLESEEAANGAGFAGRTASGGGGGGGSSRTASSGGARPPVETGGTGLRLPPARRYPAGSGGAAAKANSGGSQAALPPPPPSPQQQQQFIPLDFSGIAVVPATTTGLLAPLLPSNVATHGSTRIPPAEDTAGLLAAFSATRSLSSPSKFCGRDSRESGDFQKGTTEPAKTVNLALALQQQQQQQPLVPRPPPVREGTTSLPPLAAAGALRGRPLVVSSSPVLASAGLSGALPAADGHARTQPNNRGTNPAAITTTPTATPRQAALRGAAAPPSSALVPPSGSHQRTRGRHQPAQQGPTPHQLRFAAWISDATNALFAEYAKRDRAALRIQCAWRSAKARLASHNRRQIYYYFLHQRQAAAAAAIQSTLQIKLTEKRRREAVVVRKAASAARVECERKQRKAILIIEKFLRTTVSRRKNRVALMRQLELEQEAKLKQYDIAAVVIQRWWPIVKKEKAYWRRRSKEVEAIRQEEEVRRKRDLAQVKIASLWRGHTTRLWMNEYRIQRKEEQRQLQRRLLESIGLIKTVLRELRARRERLRLEDIRTDSMRKDAVATIESGWQEALERRAVAEVHAKALRMKNGACGIQRCYRCYRARRELRVLRVICRATTQIRQEKEVKREVAALKIQCFFRCFLARRTRRRILASHGRRLLQATWALQRVGRGFNDRASVGSGYALQVQLLRRTFAEAAARRDALVARIQAFARCHVSAGCSVARVHAVEAEERYIYQRMMKERREEPAAIKIQSAWRMVKGKRMAADRRREIEAEVAVITRAATTIQCLARKAAAKQRVAKKRTEAELLRCRRKERELVQNELFAMRSSELSVIEAAARAYVEEDEATARSKLLLATLARPLVRVGGSRRAGGGSPEPDDTTSGNDEEEHVGSPVLVPAPNNAQLLLPVAVDEDESDGATTEEGIYD